MSKDILKRLFLSGKETRNRGARNRRIHQANAEDMTRLLDSYEPVFFLNTGRSGSKFLTHLMGQCAKIDGYHEAFPNLMHLPNFCLSCQDNDILRAIVISSRHELVLKSMLEDKLFVETNHALTFLAHQIASVFRRSKFVHIIRHPGDFVVSAIKKGWHKNDSIWEEGRIKMEDGDSWRKLSHISKLGWTWNRTHEFIENFKSHLSADRVITLRLEDLIKEPQIASQLLKFICDEELNVTEEILNKKINKGGRRPKDPPTMFKIDHFPPYTEWGDKDRADLTQQVLPLAKKYSYSL